MYLYVRRMDSKIGGEKISKSMAEYMKIVEKQNLERVQKLKKLRRTNIITGLAIGAAVLGIYGYTMFSVKQESFLDDFEEPAKVRQ